jgi:hypothetical protein
MSCFQECQSARKEAKESGTNGRSSNPVRRTAIACRQGLSLISLSTNYREMQERKGVTEGGVAMAMLTRNKVADMLGVSVATVRRMEGKSLHPRMVDGAWMFELDEVISIQRSPRPAANRPPSEGEVAAEIFRRFDEGQSLRKIVRDCRQSPKVVQALYREWGTPLGEKPEADAVDRHAQLLQDEQDLVRWEESMKAMTAADEENDLQGLLAREARRERRARQRRRLPQAPA